MRSKNVIKVKNAEGCPDTQAEIVIQNQINYTPKVSIIIPVYNTSEYLHQCLDSVANQTLKEIEIICVDDGSTDNSLEILKEYAQKDKRISVLRQENLHAGVARNAGLTVARGEYIHFLDSDDWVEDDTYRKLYRLIQSRKVDLLKFRSYIYDNSLKQISTTYYTDLGAIPDNQFDIILDFEKDYKLLIHVSDAPWSGIYKSSFLKGNCIRFDNYICANDVGFYFRCITKAKAIGLSRKRVVYYRINNEKSLVGMRAFHFDCQIKTSILLNKIAETYQKKINIKIKEHSNSTLLKWYQRLFMRECNNVPFLIRKKSWELVRTYLKKVPREEIPSWAQILYFSFLKEVTVSVIIPVYNTAKYLRECLDSVVNQTLWNIEIICIDDGSTDNSLEILKEYAKKDKRIKILTQNHQKQGAARNKGIEIAKGEYIFFLDSDDYLMNNTLERLYTTAMGNQLDMLLFSGSNFRDEENTLLDNPYWDYNYIPADFNNMGFSYKNCLSFLHRLPVSTCLTMYSKKFLLQNNIVFPINLYHEDNVFFFKSITQSKRCGLLKEKLYCRRLHGSSTTQNWNALYLDFVKIAEILLQYLQKIHIDRNAFKNFVNSYCNNINSHWAELSTEEQQKYEKDVRNLFQKYKYKENPYFCRWQYSLFGLPIFKKENSQEMNFLSLLGIPIYKIQRNREIHAKKVKFLGIPFYRRSVCGPKKRVFLLEVPLTSSNTSENDFKKRFLFFKYRRIKENVFDTKTFSVCGLPLYQSKRNLDTHGRKVKFLGIPFYRRSVCGPKKKTYILEIPVASSTIMGYDMVKHFLFFHHKEHNWNAEIRDLICGTSQHISYLEDKINNIDNKINNIDNKINNIDNKINNIDNKIKGIEGKIENISPEMQKKLNQSFILNSEQYWAHIFHDTILNSSWLKNKSVSPGRWAVSYIVLYVLYRILEEFKPKSILECGLGQSSKLTIQYSDSYNADLTICENSFEWVSFFEKHFPTVRRYIKMLDVEMIKLVEPFESRTYANFSSATLDKKFNLVLIDAPVGSKRYSRPEILDVVEHLDKSFVILLDDMNRMGEQDTWELLKEKMTKAGISFVEKIYSSDKSLGMLVSPDLKFFTSL